MVKKSQSKRIVQKGGTGDDTPIPVQLICCEQINNENDFISKIRDGKKFTFSKYDILNSKQIFSDDRKRDKIIQLIDNSKQSNGIVDGDDLKNILLPSANNTSSNITDGNTTANNIIDNNASNATNGNAPTTDAEVAKLYKLFRKQQLDKKLLSETENNFGSPIVTEDGHNIYITDKQFRIFLIDCFNSECEIYAHEKSKNPPMMHDGFKLFEHAQNATNPKLPKYVIVDDTDPSKIAVGFLDGPGTNHDKKNLSKVYPKERLTSSFENATRVASNGSTYKLSDKIADGFYKTLPKNTKDTSERLYSVADNIVATKKNKNIYEANDPLTRKNYTYTVVHDPTARNNYIVTTTNTQHITGGGGLCNKKTSSKTKRLSKAQPKSKRMSKLKRVSKPKTQSKTKRVSKPKTQTKTKRASKPKRKSKHISKK